MHNRTERTIFVTVVGVALAAVMTACDAAQVKLNVGMAKPALLADQKQTTFLKVSLTGFAWTDKTRRTPVNVAIVIDKSGSMTGEKIAKAKEAAIMAVDRLDGNDIVSVVAYDSNIRVLVPATKVADRAAIRAAINQLSAGGTTALFAGVSKGAAEIRKFLDKNRVNRVVLLSDGLANVGPSCPDQLGALGSSLIKEGISVTTIGLGTDYNEDLMTQLARKSDGNHYFARSARQLVQIFKNELGDVLSVCAQEITVQIKCADGIRPVRVLGREAEIAGQNVVAVLNQLYSAQDKYVLLEVEVPATADGKTRPVADEDVSYANMATRTTEKLSSRVAVRFTKSKEVVETNVNRDVTVSAIMLTATDVNKKAVALLDQGKKQEAQKLLLDNARILKENAKKYRSVTLDDYSAANHSDGMTVTYFDSHVEFKASALRKRMTEYQYMNDYQQMMDNYEYLDSGEAGKTK